VTLSTNSSSFETVWDTRRSALVTKYGNDVVSIYCSKSPAYTSSIDSCEQQGNVSLDKTFDSHYHYNEIPWSEYVTSSRETPFVDGCDKLYKRSPRGNLAFRYQQKNQHGYSREYRNSPRDYSDDFWASASIQQHKNTTYYEDRSGYSGSERVQTIREHQSNKWYSENIGEYQDAFYNYGSGSVSSSNPLTAFTSDYYLNTKKCILTNSLNVISYNALYGDAYDSLICNLYPKTGKDLDRNLLFNENWSIPSGCWGYFGKPTFGVVWPESIEYAIGESIKHPCSGTILGDNYYKNRELWWVGGVSGTLTLVGNNNDLLTSGENIIPNAAIMKSYYSTGAYTGMCSGTYDNSVNYPIWREPAMLASYFELTSSMIFNSMASFGSASSQVTFFEFIFSSIYPIIDETIVLDKDIKKTQGLTFGICGGYSAWEQGVPWELSDPITNYNYNFMFPIINFSPDGNIKIITSDEYLKPYFKNTGEKWLNNEIYKISMFLNTADQNYNNGFSIELMINDRFVDTFNINEALVAFEYYYLVKYYWAVMSSVEPKTIIESAHSFSRTVNISQLFFANIYCKEYEEHEIFTIRDVRFCNKFINGVVIPSIQDETFNPDYCASKVVSRNLKCDSYKGQLRKKISGATQKNAISILSGSDYAMSSLCDRPILYNVERCSKLFENNINKIWFFESELFPYYIP
jgi:hypothetical protein